MKDAIPSFVHFVTTFCDARLPSTGFCCCCSSSSLTDSLDLFFIFYLSNFLFCVIIDYFRSVHMASYNIIVTMWIPNNSKKAFVLWVIKGLRLFLTNARFFSSNFFNSVFFADFVSKFLVYLPCQYEWRYIRPKSQLNVCFRRITKMSLSNSESTVFHVCI